MNYQKVLDEILDKIGNDTPKLLLHACCAPCSSYVLEYLSKYFEITLYYYNPNIHPELEYNRRIEELKKFINELNGVNKIDLVEEEYNTSEYFNEVKGVTTVINLEWIKQLYMLKIIITIILQRLFQLAHTKYQTG